MEAKDLITLMGIIVSLIVGFAGLYVSVRNSRKTIFINTVTSLRSKWMETTRNSISEYCALTTQLFFNTVSDKLSKIEKLQQLRFLIKLQLNRNDPFDSKVIDLLEKIASHFYDDTINATKQEIEELINLTQDMLKIEWEGIKAESLKGKLSEKQKNELVNQFLNQKRSSK